MADEFEIVHMKSRDGSDQVTKIEVPAGLSNDEVKSLLAEEGVNWQHPSYQGPDQRVSVRGNERPELFTEGGFGPAFWRTLDTLDVPRAFTLQYMHALNATGDHEFAVERAQQGFENDDHPVIGDMVFNYLQDSKPRVASKEALRQAEMEANPAYALHEESRLAGDLSQNLMVSGGGRSQHNMDAINSLVHNPEAVAAISAVGGTLADIAVDPITYISAPLKAAGMAAKEASKVAKWAGAQAKSQLTKVAPEFMLKAAAKVKGGAGAIKDVVGKGFNPAHDLGEQAGFHKLQVHMMDRLQLKKDGLIQDAKAFRGKVKEIAKDMNIPADDVNRFINQMVERGEDGIKAIEDVDPAVLQNMIENPQILSMVDKVNRKNALQLRTEQRIGAPTGDIAGGPTRELREWEGAVRQEMTKTGSMDKVTQVVSPKTGKYVQVAEAQSAIRKARQAEAEGDMLNYINHLATDEYLDWQKATKKTGGKKGRARRKDAEHASQLKRAKDWRDMSIEEINTAARNGVLPGAEGFTGKVFRTNTESVQAVRDMRHAEVKNVGDLIGEAYRKGFGIEVNKLMEGSKAAKIGKLGPDGTVRQVYDPRDIRRALEKQGKGDWVQPKNPVAQGGFMPPEVAQRVDGLWDAMNNPETQHGLLQAFDAVQNTWKMWTTLPIPSFHSRNLLSNTFNNYIAGVRPGSGAYSNAATMMRWSKGKADVPIQIGELNTTAKELAKEIEKFAPGVKKGGFVEDIAERQILKELDKGVKTRNPNQWLREEVGPMGQMVDNFSRMANYIDGRAKGLTPDQAQERAIKTLFDYGDLADFEKNVMKRIMPFYTWSRKNIPFQVENFIKQPGKYKAFDTVRRNVEAGLAHESVGEDDRFLAEYMLDSLPTKVSADENGNVGVMLFGGIIPAGDLSSFLDGQQFFINQLTPAAKAFIEWNMGESLFSGAKLDNDLKTDFLIDPVASYKQGKVVKGRVGQKTKNLLQNLRVLSVIDEFINANNPEAMEVKSTGRPDNRVQSMEDFLLKYVGPGLRKFEVSLAQQKAAMAQQVGRESNDLMRKNLKQLTNARAADPGQMLKEFRTSAEESQKRMLDAIEFMRD